MDYLSFAHGLYHYAVPLDHVRYIAAEKSLPVTRVAHGGGAPKNTVQFEKQTCLLLTMGELLGETSEQHRIADLLRLLKEREKDHLDWVNELEQALKNNTPFQKTTDPHACAFGRWYDSFKPDSPELAALMAKFDQPHQRIHALGKELIDMRKAGATEQALQELRKHRETTLKRLLDLFSDARAMVSGSIRPTVIMLQQQPGKMLGLKVDHIGEVFEGTTPQKDNSSNCYMPYFAEGWLKNVNLSTGNNVTTLVIDPALIRNELPKDKDKLEVVAEAGPEANQSLAS